MAMFDIVVLSPVLESGREKTKVRRLFSPSAQDIQYDIIAGQLLSLGTYSEV